MQLLTNSPLSWDKGFQNFIRGPYHVQWTIWQALISSLSQDQANNKFCRQASLAEKNRCSLPYYFLKSKIMQILFEEVSKGSNNMNWVCIFIVVRPPEGKIQRGPLPDWHNTLFLTLVWRQYEQIPWCEVTWEHFERENKSPIIFVTPMVSILFELYKLTHKCPCVISYHERRKSIWNSISAKWLDLKSSSIPFLHRGSAVKTQWAPRRWWVLVMTDYWMGLMKYIPISTPVK